MKPRERRETGQSDMFTDRLDRTIDMTHPRVRLAQRIDWGFLEGKFGAVYADGPGSPPLPTRLMAGLAILKYSENLSDERLCEAWLGTRIINISAARSSSSISFPSTARP